MRWFVGAMILALTIPVLACGGGDSNVSSPLAVGTPETQAPGPSPWEVYSSGPARDISSGLTAAAIMISTRDLSGTLERLAGQNTVETTATALHHLYFATFHCAQLRKLPRGTAAFNSVDDACAGGQEMTSPIQSGNYEEVSDWAAETEAAAEDYFWQSCPVDKNAEGAQVLWAANLAVHSENSWSDLSLSTEESLFSDSELAFYAAAHVEGLCGLFLGAARISPEGEPLFPALLERIDAPCSAADSQGLQSLVATGQREQASALAWDIYKAAAGYLVSTCSSALSATK